MACQEDQIVPLICLNVCQQLMWLHYQWKCVYTGLDNLSQIKSISWRNSVVWLIAFLPASLSAQLCAPLCCLCCCSLLVFQLPLHCGAIWSERQIKGTASISVDISIKANCCLFSQTELGPSTKQNSLSVQCSTSHCKQVVYHASDGLMLMLAPASTDVFSFSLSHFLFSFYSSP